MMAEAKKNDEIRFSFFGLNFRLSVKRYLTLAFRVWLALSLILLVSSYFFQYEMTNADIPGGFIFGGLLAYLFHILIDQKDE